MYVMEEKESDDVESMGNGGPFLEENNNNGDRMEEAGKSFSELNDNHEDGCFTALGGEDGEESDCGLTLDMSPWTSEENGVIEMWDAVSAAGGGGDGPRCGFMFKENPQPPITEIEKINGCHVGNSGVSGVGLGLREDPEPPRTMGTEAINECDGRGSDGGGGGGEERVMRKGPWTAAEDALLMKVVEELGSGDWVAIERYSGLARTSKSCRLRWTNHLRPNLKKGSFSSDEERHVVKMHYKFGNKWSRMARHLPGRTDNEIKNFWHSRVKKCKKQGLPIYPDWCREEDESSKNGDNYDVDDQPNHVSSSVDNSSIMFTDMPLPEVQLDSSSAHPHDQESLLHCSNPTTLPNSSLAPNNQLCFIQQPPLMCQRTEVPIFESHSSQAPATLSCQQPYISAHDISQDHLTSACRSTSLSASNPSPEMQYYSSDGQYFLSDPLYLSSSDEAKWLQCQPFSSFSTQPYLSLPPEYHCLSAQEPSFECFPDLSVSKSSSGASKHFRPPPVLSPPSGRFKRQHRTTSQLPPVPKPTQSSFPEQGQCVSASRGEPHFSPELNLPTSESAIPPFRRDSSMEFPTSTSVELNKSTMTPQAFRKINSSPLEVSHPFVRMNLSTPTPPESYAQINSSAKAPPGSSLNGYLPTSQLPVSTTQLSSSVSQGYSSIVNSEPPSIQSTSRDMKLDPEMKRSQLKAKSKSFSNFLDASLSQAVQAEASSSDLNLVKGYLLSKQLKMKHLHGNMSGRTTSQGTTSDKGVLLGGSPSEDRFLSRSLSCVMMRKRSETQDFTGNHMYRNSPLNGSSKSKSFSTGNSTNDCSTNLNSYGNELLARSQGVAVPSDNSRKQDLLRKLVENSKKENLLRDLLKRQNSIGSNSQLEVLLREGLVPEDSTLIQSFDSEKLLMEISKQKGTMTGSLETECSSSTSSKRDRHSRDELLGKDLSEGYSNPQERASVPGEFAHPNLKPLPVSDSSGSNLHREEIPASHRLYSKSDSFKRLRARDDRRIGDSFHESSERLSPLANHGQEQVFDALDPLFNQNTGTTPLRSGDSFRGSTCFQSNEGDCSAESLEREWPKSLKTEYIEDQTLTNQLGERLKGEELLESQDQQQGICESSLLPCQYAGAGLTKIGHPGAELSSSKTSKSGSLDRCLNKEDSLCKSLERSTIRDQDLDKELFKESSIEEPGLGSVEPNPSENGPYPFIIQSNTDYMAESRVQSGESGIVYYYPGDCERQSSEEERQLASQQPKKLHNGWDPFICQSTRAHMSEPCLHNGTSGSAYRSAGEEVQQELEEEHVNTLPEELSSLLEFFATTAREFTGMQFLDEYDMSLGLDDDFDSSPPMTSIDSTFVSAAAD